METENKTPVEIIQELIAIHTTRKEAIEKFAGRQGDESFASKLKAAGEQSDSFIAGLMSELSNFGDAVAGSVDRENAYQQTWTNTLGNIDNMSPQDCARVFNEMEQHLKAFYAEVIQTKTELPLSLSELINKQAASVQTP